MRVIFRVDASSEIGAGHFMRCLTLARALKAYGHEVTFLCRHLPNVFNDLLIKFNVILEKMVSVEEKESYEYSSEQYESWLGVSQEKDAFDTIKKIGNKRFDWLVVDHYALDECWERIVKPYVQRLMVIDDLANRYHLCDLVLDQNYYENISDRYLPYVPKSSHQLLGPSFALLRPEFGEMRRFCTYRNGDISKILVNFGGVDITNYTEPTIEALKLIQGIRSVDVVIGNQHPFKQIIIDKCASYGFKLHVQTEKMSELISQCDFAIGASGSTTWERCCLGLPSLAIPIAENQKAIALGAQKLAVHDLLEIKSNVETEIHARLIELQLRQEYVSQLSINGMKVVDGLGVNRVMECLQ
jgi:UDP-2,4-diacetamido-2,4,6-trideoxy-beta-L-altropyranose hydrolase